MHTHILIPTDGSDLSDEAIQTALPWRRPSTQR